jgi:N-acetylglutamate synthase/N-acetylornithine aminotransferase
VPTNDSFVLLGRKRHHHRRGLVSGAARRFLAAPASWLGIVHGGEGATKLIAVTVSDAASVMRHARWADDRELPLVKTAVHGADPNWGRSSRPQGDPAAFDIDPRPPVGGTLLPENGCQMM